LAICKWLQPQLQILPDILFIVEAQFCGDGDINTKKSHSWAQGNSHKAAQCYIQHWYSVNKWYGVSRYILQFHITGIFWKI